LIDAAVAELLATGRDARAEDAARFSLTSSELMDALSEEERKAKERRSKRGHGKSRKAQVKTPAPAPLKSPIDQT
jgi:hypothetical protein